MAWVGLARLSQLESKQLSKVPLAILPEVRTGSWLLGDGGAACAVGFSGMRGWEVGHSVQFFLREV